VSIHITDLCFSGTSCQLYLACSILSFVCLWATHLLSFSFKCGNMYSDVVTVDNGTVLFFCVVERL